MRLPTGGGHRTAPDNVKAGNPAFDVTPNDLITGIITERGILGTSPYDQSIRILTIPEYEIPLCQR